MNKSILLLNTIKYLKAKQIYYRLFYFVRNRYRKAFGVRYSFTKDSSSISLNLDESLLNHHSNVKDKRFEFLNLEFDFKDSIDWNYAGYGKLWTYNLTYFEYLKEKEYVWLIYGFIKNIESIKDGLESFPISLRGINWIKFLTKFGIKEKKIDDSLYAQYYILLDNLEYHLLGNHLLENGFSLLFGAYYFKDDVLYEKAREILEEELKEQILEDGGHFELSPMYHQLMLFRLLDCVNLVQNNNWNKQELLEFLTIKAELMLGWLENMTFKNGEPPLLNDSANKITPTSKELFGYAKKLGINSKKMALKESGYRKIDKKNYECIVDVGKIGPDYIPGHAHADTFNFVLNIDNKPFIVDSGLSTYENGKIRDYERSTEAHNTVEISGQNSSQIWGGFRVANRAKVINMKEKDNWIKATQNGYKPVLHTREWKFEEEKIIILDSLSKAGDAVFRLHFHPDISEQEIKRRVKANNYKIKKCFIAFEYNKRIESKILEIEFEKDLKVEIYI